MATTVKRILNCIESIGTENDWSSVDAMDAGILKASKVALPETVDLRENWWKINDQGDTGSCVGWSTADGLLRWHFVKNKQIKNNELLSVRFIWMASKETDEFTSRPSSFIEEAGTSLKSALDVTRKYGCVLDKLLPFSTNQLYKGQERTLYAVAAAMKTKSYFNLIQGNTNKLAAWKQWLADGKGPILTRLDVDDTWQNATKTKGKLTTYKALTANGGHAVCIVGYNKNGFIIRNSWGESWGDKGYAYASLEYAKDAFTEAYGVTV